MSLSRKIALILTAVIGLYAVANEQIQDRVFFERFVQVEHDEAAQDLARVIEAIEEQIGDLDRVSLKWSAWDDTYAYVAEPSRRFEVSNLTPTALANHDIDLLFFCDLDGTVIWSTITDPESGEATTLRDFPREQLFESHPLLLRPTEDEEVTKRPVGVMLTELGPLLVSARPILRTDQGGEARGTVIIGRFLSGGLDRELTKQTRVDFDFWPVDGRVELGAEEAEVLDEVTAETRPVVRERGANLLHVYGTFNDIRQRPELLLRANVTREITATGATAVQFGFVSTLVAGLVMLLVLMGLLQKIVIAPVRKLTDHAEKIGQTEDFRAKLDLRRTDEVGTLSREFDNMMEKLECAQAALVDTARTAGMSEIATGILHNVGNVLNSVNISASMVAQRVEGMSIDDLEKLATILTENKDNLGQFVENDPQGKHLQPFLTALAVQLGEERVTLAAEVGSLNEGIEHICELIKSQQSYAIQSDLVEPVSLADKLDEAVAITEKASAKDATLEVIRDHDDLPDIVLDKHKLIEILVNIVQNARQAMSETQGIRRLTLRTRLVGDDRVQVEIADTGKGIPPENLIKVFALGFTTRPNGHGYGLHTAANAATEMGGGLTAHSEGIDQGATFTLELPLRVTVGEGA